MSRNTLYLFLGIMALLHFAFPADAASAEEERYKRSEESYAVPDVTLVDQNRRKVKLRDFILNADKPVLLDFIYGTCTTICPILSAGFVNMQRKLGPDREQVRLVSISIDPEHDSPEVMTEYLARYGAQPGWDFLTGTREDIDRVMRAFDSYVTNKMNHYPVTFLLKPGGEKWVRIYGLLSTADLMKEYQAIAGK